MFDLTGKRALVTGASGGIGAAIAHALGARGAMVVLTGTRPEALEATAAGMAGQSIILPCNLADRDAVSGLVDSANDAAGGNIDILVNNAGITRDGLMMRMKDEDWDAVLAVNLTAAMITSRAVLRGMMKSRWGRIIQIASIVGYTGNPGQANYAAAKAGLAGFTKSLAAEVASRGITANIIAPGFITTAMTAALSEDQQAALLANVPAGAMGEPQDIAAAVCYLASSEARYVTGASLHINGGMAML